MSLVEAMARVRALRDNLVGAKNREMRKDREALTMLLNAVRLRR